jgi:Fibronectin type III domain
MSAPSPPQANPLPRVGPTTLEFWWDPPATDGGSPVTSYTLQCTAISYSQTFSPSDYYALVTGLTTGTSYLFFITATNTNGTSAPAYFRASICGTFPSAPQNLTVTPSGANFQTSWTAPVSDGGATLKYYSIYAEPAYPDYVSTMSFGNPASKTERFLNMSNSSQNYTIRVFAVNDPGYSSDSVSSGFVLWQPSQLSSLILWLDSAQKSTTAGFGTTNQWIDRSPANHTMNFLSGTAPALSNWDSTPYPTMYSQGTVLYRNSPTWNLWSDSNEMACFCVVSSIQSDSSVTSGIFGSSGQNWPTNTSLRNNGPNWAYRTNNIDYSINIGQSNISTPTILTVTQCSDEFGGPSQSTIYLSVNASTSITSNNANLPTSIAHDLFIGKLAQDLDGYGWVGGLPELILCSNGLNQEQRQKTEGYLAWKWGLVSYLPSDHPYYSSPPPA